MNFEIVTEGLEFPEGPVAMDDGSVVLVEIRRGALTLLDEGTLVGVDSPARPQHLDPSGCILRCQR